MYGALLHDIGKLVQRAGPGEGSHGDRGADFISEKLFAGGEWSEVLDCIRYHHYDSLRGAQLAEDSPAYLVCEADNIAAGADRRQKDAGPEPGGFRKDMPLYSIFNVFRQDGSGKDSVLPLKTLEEAGQITFPLDAGRVEVSPLQYTHLLQVFEKGLKEMSVEQDSLESLMKLLEVCLANVPSSTYTAEMPDISLYNHSKITAMVAGCLYYYLQEQGDSNYKEACFEQPEKLRLARSMLLVSGDMSGIQNFIYTISSKRALKSLRGRSFYLEIFMEQVIDEILEACGLCRANLLYSGGGHFYLVLPNTGIARSVLSSAKEQINTWLMGMYATDLYLEISSVEASAHELANGFSRGKRQENLLGNLFRQAARANSLGKLQRYSYEQLEQLTDPDSLLNKQLEAGRECSICGSSRHKLVEWEEILLCGGCLSLIKAGDMLARMGDREEERPVAVIGPVSSAGDGLLLPSIKHEQVSLTFAGLDEAEKLLRRGRAYRVYSINSFLTGKNYLTNLWAGTYSTAGDGEGLVDFATLAGRSCGVKRIGVLRADVDNLGQAFISGFVLPERYHDRFRYVTLSRHAALSYSLSLFFKHEINKLCQGRVGSLEPFQLPGSAKQAGAGRNVVIVYAGGDDVFIVGAWDEVLELAVDLYRAFRKFTRGKMTLSAGVGLFHDSYPVSRMAELTGYLEQAAKTGNKNKLSLFGPEIGQGEEQGRPLYKHVYLWEDFTERVCGEKLAGLLRWFSLEGDRKEPGKLEGGMSRLYKLLRLFRGIEAEWDKERRIELARLAYYLGRMEPAGKDRESLIGVYREMKRSVYQWALSAKERQEFITALTILIYLKRKEDSYE